ncbi:hypothetical protein KC19_1G123600 [Ceratodon purpureus]|uniref:Uncharacterized protein n=1 Tax=Ceratodon purpureus TaxID=3225 RepID=A0A8T0J4B9_CERPU|nr:hypothetical protein KC19_1G123600 [Ceratodon purpureus]
MEPALPQKTQSIQSPDNEPRIYQRSPDKNPLQVTHQKPKSRKTATSTCSWSQHLYHLHHLLHNHQRSAVQRLVSLPSPNLVSG